MLLHLFPPDSSKRHQSILQHVPDCALWPSPTSTFGRDPVGDRTSTFAAAVQATHRPWSYWRWRSMFLFSCPPRPKRNPPTEPPPIPCPIQNYATSPPHTHTEPTSRTRTSRTTPEKTMPAALTIGSSFPAASHWPIRPRVGLTARRTPPAPPRAGA